MTHLTKRDILLAKKAGEFHDDLIRPFSVLLRKYEGRQRAVDEKGNYKFVAALGQEVAFNLIRIRKLFNKPPTLIDVGCGVGNIVALANFLDFKSSGIELDKFYGEIGNPYNRIKIEDIFSSNKLNFQVVFVYRPLNDMEKLFVHLQKVCKKGTIIYSFGVIPNIGTPVLNNPFIIML